MFQFWKKKEKNGDTQNNQKKSALTWNASAIAALAQAVSQAPVPSIMKGRIKSELSKAAEQATIAAGKTIVTAEHLMSGILARLPKDMRAKVEAAAKQGPKGLKKLQDELRK